MNIKNSSAEKTTITRDTITFEDRTGNIYEAIYVMSRRANQISSQLKEELNNKLQEFASSTDNLEEVFENREQIEISKFYEKMPKPAALAMEEFVDDEIYIRKIEE